jgi:hypothetical protein
VRVLESRELLPIIPNFKRALEAASGDYFMWAAADDLWDPVVAALLNTRSNDAVGECCAHVWADDTA